MLIGYSFEELRSALIRAIVTAYFPLYDPCQRFSLNICSGYRQRFTNDGMVQYTESLICLFRICVCFAVRSIEPIGATVLIYDGKNPPLNCEL